MNSIKHARSSTTNDRITEQGRMWFRFACILDTTLRAQGSRLWVKPTLHARYGLRQSVALKANTFILPSRLDGTNEEMLAAMMQRTHPPYEALHPRSATGGRLALYTADGTKLGLLCRPAWSWISPLIQLGYTPAFFLYQVAPHDGMLTAQVISAHFHDGVEMYLHEHYRQRAEEVLA